jgi:hypothetical protein
MGKKRDQGPGGLYEMRARRESKFAIIQMNDTAVGVREQANPSMYCQQIGRPCETRIRSELLTAAGIAG